MKKKIVGILALTMGLIGTGGHRAQGQSAITLDDVVPGGSKYRDHQPQMPRVLGVVPEGILLFGTESLEVKGMDGVAKTYLTKPTGATLPPLVPTADGKFLVARLLNTYHVVRTGTQEIRQIELSDAFTEVVLSPTGDMVAGSDGTNIFIAYSDGRKIAQITTDGSHDIVYGMAAHRNEFGIEKGLFFSPTGRYLAFYRIDQTQVADYPVVRMGERIAKMDPIKYPMAGEASQEVTVGVYDTQTGTTKYLNTGTPKDRYLTNIAWAPDEGSIYIDEVDRDQSRCKLVRYSVASGDAERTILTEVNERYIEPVHPIAFLPTNTRRFIRMSRTDGYRHLYLYNTDGKQMAQLTSGAWEIMSFIGVSPDSEWAYFTSNKDYTIGEDLYRVGIKSRKIERLTKGKGTHSVRMSGDFSMAYDAFSSKDNAGEAWLIKTGKKVERKLIERAETPAMATRLNAVVELGSLKSADGTTDLFYKMTRPRTIEKGKRYPVIVYVYGGPHSQLVTDTWRGLNANWDCYMADKGYIIFTMDGRGTDNRGHAFESAIHRQLGTCEMADQMKGVEYLKSLSYIDAERIGVYGWSFGGFMTTNLMLTHNDVFKVGVAGGPVIDWSRYEVMYGERYMDTPQENPEGYKKNNLTLRAGDLKGRLMLIHGAVDPVVVWQNSQEFLNAAIEARTLPDYMIYPNHEHNVIGKDRVHLYEVITRYFDDFLK